MDVLVFDPEGSLFAELEGWSPSLGLRVAHAESPRALAWQSFDAVLVNFDELGSDAFQALARMRADALHLPMLVMSYENQTDRRIAAPAPGADDYVLRPCEPAELVVRIQSVCRRSRRAAQGEIEVAELRLDPTRRIVSAQGRQITLTGSEFGLVELLASRAGRTVSTADIIQHLYGERRNVSSSIIRVFVCAVRKKLDQLGCGHLIATHHGFGYRLSVPDAGTLPAQFQFASTNGFATFGR